MLAATLLAVTVAGRKRQTHLTPWEYMVNPQVETLTLALTPSQLNIYFTPHLAALHRPAIYL